MIATWPNPSTEDAHKAIAHHEEETRRLTQVYNAHSRAATLPASVLALIFLEQATYFYERRLAFWSGAVGENISEAAHKPIYSWVEVSYVCRSWREAALHSAELWTTIVLDERVQAKFIKLLLDRSRGLPLTVVMHAAEEDYHCLSCSAEGDRGNTNYDDAVIILKEILPRTRRLSVFFNKGRHEEVWEVLEGLANASKLEYLRLEATGFLCYEPPSRYSSGRALVVIPSSISSLVPPKLSSLVICGAGFEWSNALLCLTLRRLKLSVYNFDQETNLEHLLAALRNMPQLESLDVDDIPPASAATPHGRASLRNLQDLRIPLENKNSAPFLLSLDIPSTTYVLLFTQPSRTFLRDRKKVIPEDVQNVVVAAVKTFLAKETIYAVSHEHEDLIGYDSPPRTSVWSIGQSDAPAGDVLSWEAVEVHSPRIALGVTLHSPLMVKLLDALGPQSLRAAKIHETSWDPREFLECLRGAENLTCLQLQGEVAIGIGGALCGWTRPAYLDVDLPPKHFPRPGWYGFGEVGDDCWVVSAEDQSASPPEPPSPLLFPRLRTLGISEVDFPVRNPDPGEKVYMYKPDIWDAYKIPYGLDVKGLVKGLRLRSGAGASQVLRVEFASCQCVDREQLVSLAEVVPEVIWDGRRITLQEAHSISQKFAANI